jgi:GH25 family lysozyme M1 (1,4-beta-N-acetylmuramidase)
LCSILKGMKRFADSPHSYAEEPISGGTMPESKVVIDLSHHNQNLDFATIGSSGILGIIHNATQGLNYAAPTYPEHNADALDNGLLGCAYHFGTGSDGVQQTEQFLNVVQLDARTLLVLDFACKGWKTVAAALRRHPLVAASFQTRRRVTDYQSPRNLCCLPLTIFEEGSGC